MGFPPLLRDEENLGDVELDAAVLRRDLESLPERRRCFVEGPHFHVAGAAQVQEFRAVGEDFLCVVDRLEAFEDALLLEKPRRLAEVLCECCPLVIRQIEEILLRWQQLLNGLIGRCGLFVLGVERA